MSSIRLLAVLSGCVACAVALAQDRATPRDLPVGRVRTAADIQSALQPGELLLEFTFLRDDGLLYVFGPEGAIETVPLPGISPMNFQRPLD